VDKNSFERTPADLVLTDARICTLDPALPWTDAVAIRQGRIAALGSNDVRDVIGRRTNVIPLANRMMLPGFQDAHLHAGYGGLGMVECDLSDAFDADSYREIISAFERSHPSDPWIVGGGWSMGSFEGGTPSRELLDELVPNRPTILLNRDGHGAWANSRALEIAGISASTPDPVDGRIERGGTGEPQGTLHEGAMSLVLRHVPPPTADVLRRAVLEAQRYLHSLGITSWQDALIGATYDWGRGFDILDIYRSLAESGELTARVVGALWWDHRSGSEQLDEMVELRRSSSIGRFRASAVKILQDGILENATGALLAPYEGTDETGLSFIEPEKLNSIVRALDEASFQVHFHAIGDRAVRECLDAVYVAQIMNGPRGLRHNIAHIELIAPEDIRRFTELEVVANGQPLWACHEAQLDELVLPFIGPRRADQLFPFNSLIGAGARLAFGSDWAVSSAHPLEQIGVAVSRTPPTQFPYGVGEGTPLVERERVTFEEALYAFTMGSAYVNHQEDVTGSISMGKYADLVVLERSVFDADVAELASIGFVLTMVGGQIVHASGAFQGLDAAQGP
jgi:predicted amidohydrolase YtcJ